MSIDKPEPPPPPEPQGLLALTGLAAFLDDKRAERDARPDPPDRTLERAHPGPDTHSDQPAGSDLAPDGPRNEHVDRLAGLFDQGGDYARLWDREQQGFDESAWDDMPQDERDVFAQRVEDERAQAFGSEPARVELLGMEEGVYGGSADGGMLVNGDLSCDDTFRTVVHEGYHLYQDETVRDAGATHPHREEWVTNRLDGNYVPPAVDEAEHRAQPIERDAYAYEDLVLREMAERLETGDGR